jgi:hypothetical protein
MSNVGRRIYLASSWRSESHPSVLAALRADHHEVYDYRSEVSDGGQPFSWELIDPDWRSWTAQQFREALEDDSADRQFGMDLDALGWCDTCVLIAPAGRSSHLEAGWCAARDKQVLVLLEPGFVPELMYGLTSRCCISLWGN